jgi:hypothetical protein
MAAAVAQSRRHRLLGWAAAQCKQPLVLRPTHGRCSKYHHLPFCWQKPPTTNDLGASCKASTEVPTGQFRYPAHPCLPSNTLQSAHHNATGATSSAPHPWLPAGSAGSPGEAAPATDS